MSKLNAFFASALAMFSVVASAQTLSVGDSFPKEGITYTITSSSTVDVTGYTSDCPSNVTINSTVQNGSDSYVVKNIKDGAF